jgi:hypothetical protein
MGLFRVFSSKDTFITDRMFSTKEALRTSGSNFGASPTLQVFKLTGSTPTSSVETARTLVQFDLTELSGKIYNDRIIPSSSLSFVLKMYDQKHDGRVPIDYDLFAYPVSQSWTEGRGVDLVNFRDFGEANWLSASSTTGWVQGLTPTSGGTFLNTVDYGSGSQRFTETFQDLEMNVTDVVINWLTGGLPNNGFIIKLGSTEEDHATNSYFNKMFHSRESKYVDRLPYLEARWSEVRKDNRNNFAYDVENKLFMYNFVRGELTQLSDTVTVRVQDHIIGTSASFTGSYATTQIENGILTASITIELTGGIRFSSSFYDIWESSSKLYLSGAFTPLILTGSSVDQYDEFVIDVTNLKDVYSTDEEARIKVNVRKRDYKTHKIVHTSSLGLDREYIEKMYFTILNDETGELVVPYGTGSVPHTQLSYNGDGNYFDLYMNNFVPGFKYRLKFLIDINAHDKKEVDSEFTFKVI